MTSCRWCSTSLPPTGGRPAVWCDRTCRDRYVRTFGTRDYDGSVALTEDCAGACVLDGTTTTFAGPLSWPGAHANAAQTVATLLHGHRVRIVMSPVSGGGNVHTADDGAFKMPNRPMAVAR